MNRFALCSIALFLTLPSVFAQDKVARPRITGIAHVRIYVTDLAKAQAFYSGVLGLRSGIGTCKGLANPCFSVNPYQHVELLKTDSAEHGSFLSSIGLATSDLDQMLKYLTARGVIASEILRGPNGLRFFDVQDAEHNRITFVEPSGNDSEADHPRQISNRLFHAGFVVKDLKAESHFYEDILGFRLYWRGGFKDDGSDWYELQVPDGDNWIEYMLNIPATADKKELGVQNHFSLGVPDIHAAESKIKANGAASYDGPEVGRDGKWALDLYDPDGTRVELMEFAPVQKPCCSSYTGPHPKP